MTSPKDLHGTWHLARWDHTVNGEFRGHVMGEGAQGQIIYGTGGHKSAILSRANRPKLSASALHQCPLEERDMALLSYVSYGGLWTFDNEVVTHRLSYSSFPNWRGTNLVRHVSWNIIERRAPAAR